MVGSSLVGRGAIYPMTTLSFLEFLEIRTEFDRRHISGLEGTILTPLFSELLREYRIYG